MVVVNTSIGRDGYRSRSSLTTVWQRTKSPIHMYGTIRIGGLRLIGDRARIANSESGFVPHLGLNRRSSFVPLSQTLGAEILGHRDGRDSGLAPATRVSRRPGPVQEPGGRAEGDFSLHCAPRRVSCMAGHPGAKGGLDSRGGYGMLLVTGGAGFIGSNLVASLNEA